MKNICKSISKTGKSAFSAVSRRRTDRRFIGFFFAAILLSGVFAVLPVNAASSWSKPRPSTYRVFDDKIGNAASDASAAVGLGVDVYDYVESGGGYPYDEVRLRTSVSANARIGTQYQRNYALHGYYWLDVTDPTGITGDNSGAWIQLGFTLLFYGVNYDRIWVCSNGFICLDSALTDPVPKSIPSKDQINTIIAPFWRDLKPNLGGSITTGMRDFDVKTYFVISWNNVPDANNVPQTFEAMIEIRQGWGSSDYHNKIYFQYKSVTKDLTTTVGIENQLGDKAYSFSLSDVGNSVNLGVASWGAWQLVQMTLKLTKSDSYGKIEAMETDKGGYNVYLQNTDPVPWGGVFESAIGLAADLLLPAKAAIMFGILVITAQTAGVLAGDLSLPQFESTDADFGQNEAHVTAQCYDEKYGGSAHDATLSSIFLWQFSDPNNRAHSLTITAELLYEDIVDLSYHTITTSTTLYLYTGYHYVDVNTLLIGAGQTTGATIWIDGAAYSSPVSSLIVSEGSHSFQCQSPIYRSSKKYIFDHWNDGTASNYRVISVTADQALTVYYKARYTLTISVYSTPPNAGTTSPSPGSTEYSDGTVVPVTATAYSGYVFSCWLLDGTYYYYTNPYSVTMNQGHSLTAYFTYSGGGGGGCPYVSTWNGTDYALDNNLLPFSRLGNGLDVEDYYMLEQPPVKHNGKYSLVISEFENEHSYLDQVKLLAVDHDYDVNIAVTPSGEILTYRNPAPPISCVDNNGIDRLSQIRYIDGSLSDPTTYFQGNKNDYLELNFGQIKAGPAKLIVRNDQLCMDKCVWVQVKNASGEWETIEVIASRATWATEGVNLSPYLIDGQDLMVRLLFTQPHKLDFVGLDTAAQDDYEVHYANLASATHSTEGNVKRLLKENDNKSAELVPDQQIQLDYTLPNNLRQLRTFILYVEGHYYSIT